METNESEQRIKEIARELAFATLKNDLEKLEKAKVSIARFSTETLERADAGGAGWKDYRSGASAALTALLSTLREHLLSPNAWSLLLRRNHARVLNAVTAWPSLRQIDLAERLGVKESNLSTYLRDLANAGFVEPGISKQARGKAWVTTPWGTRALAMLLEHGLDALVPKDELKKGALALVLNDQTRATPPAEISKSAFYSLLRKAAKTPSSAPLRLSTFFRGDLREHERPWKLHHEVFEARKTLRPISWIFLRDKNTEGWVQELVHKAEGNVHLTVYGLDAVEDPVPTVQVLDDSGLLYPISPDDAALVVPYEEAVAAWESHRRSARVLLKQGKPTAA